MSKKVSGQLKLGQLVRFRAPREEIGRICKVTTLGRNNEHISYGVQTSTELYAGVLRSQLHVIPNLTPSSWTYPAIIKLIKSDKLPPLPL